MKAWGVTDGNCNTGVTYIIFAETRGKAIRYALDHCDGAFDWYEWTEMRALREPKLDKYYRGKPEMEWDCAEDRIAMVKDAGFYCTYEFSDDDLGCETCPAREWCSRHENMMEGKHNDD